MVIAIKYGAQKEWISELLSQFFRISGKGIDANKYADQIIRFPDYFS